MPNHFFITGSSGFLGKKLLEKLLMCDPLLRLTLLEHQAKIVIEEEYRDRVTVTTDTFENLRTLQGVDVLIHLAGATHAKNENLYRVINTEGTEKLLRLAKDSGVKHFICVSTTALGDSCGAYGASKLEAEKAVRRGGVPYTIVRFAEVYEAARGFASTFGKKIVWVPIPQVLIRAAKRGLFFLFAHDQVGRLICEKDYNIDLAIQDLNFSPRSFREGL